MPFMILVVLLWAALSPAASFAVEADREKVLSLYVAYDGPDVNAREFEKVSGIKVEYLTVSSGEVLARLRAEKLNPQIDI
ncbi:hypothetical protein KJ966_17860 [bacterium]|nr:hypothetical protein [bacterium]